MPATLSNASSVVYVALDRSYIFYMQKFGIYCMQDIEVGVVIKVSAMVESWELDEIKSEMEATIYLSIPFHSIHCSIEFINGDKFTKDTFYVHKSGLHTDSWRALQYPYTGMYYVFISKSITLHATINSKNQASGHSDRLGRDCHPQRHHLTSGTNSLQLQTPVLSPVWPFHEEICGRVLGVFSPVQWGQWRAYYH